MPPTPAVAEQQLGRMEHICEDVKMADMASCCRQHQLELQIIRRALLDEQKERQRDDTKLEHYIVAICHQHQLALQAIQAEIRENRPNAAAAPNGQLNKSGN
jgi:hypothetical protein